MFFRGSFRACSKPPCMYLHRALPAFRLPRNLIRAHHLNINPNSTNPPAPVKVHLDPPTRRARSLPVAQNGAMGVSPPRDADPQTQELDSWECVCEPLTSVREGHGGDRARVHHCAPISQVWVGAGRKRGSDDDKHKMMVTRASDAREK